MPPVESSWFSGGLNRSGGLSGLILKKSSIRQTVGYCHRSWTGDF